MMKRYFLLLLLMTALNCFAQKMGSFSYTVNVTSAAGGTITANQAQPYTKYTDYSTYWFVKPNGDRFLFINGGKNLGIVILHSHGNDTTIAYEQNFRGDQFLLQGTYRGMGVTVQPDPEIRLHYGAFSAGEVELHFSGPVEFAVGTNTSDHLKGNIDGTIHLYRDAQYEKTDIAPNCNCDPAIYAYLYSPEVGRSPSACENAVLWRVYGALQPAFSPLLALDQTATVHAQTGSIIYRQDHSMMDVSQAPGADPCSPDNERRDVVSINAHTRMFSQDDYSMGFIRLVNTDQFANKSMSGVNLLKALMPYQDSLMKLVMAKKMTMDDASKKTNAKSTALQGNTPVPDIKQAEVYNHLDVLAKVNITSGDIRLDRNPEIQHNVPGAAFELYKRSVKDGDGYWSPFVKYVFFGKFNIVKNGNTITSITPVYGTGHNKLTIYNTMITVKGGQDLVDQAMNTINFGAVPAILNNN